MHKVIIEQKREYLLEKLNKAIQYYNSFSDRSWNGKLKRFLKHPVKIIIRKIDAKFQKNAWVK